MRIKTISQRNRLAYRINYLILILLALGCSPQFNYVSSLSSATPTPQKLLITTEEVTTLGPSTFEPSNQTVPTHLPIQKNTPQPNSTISSNFTPIPQNKIISDYFELDSLELNRLKPFTYYILYTIGQQIHLTTVDGKEDATIGVTKGSIYSIKYDGKIIGTTGNDHTKWEFFDFDQRQIEKKLFDKPNLGDCLLGPVSPNKKWGTFLCEGVAVNLVLKNLDNQRTINIPTDHPEAYLSWSWSPDGNWLAYFRLTKRLFPKSNGTGEIMLVDTSCLGNPNNCPLIKMGPFSLSDESIMGQGPLMWSPDSQKFTFLTGINFLPFLVLDVQTRNIEKIDVIKKSGVEGMTWSPDGKWIAYSQNGKINLVSANGGQAVLIKESIDNLVGWLSTFPEPEFKVGNQLFITGAGDHLNMRTSPSKLGAVVGMLYSGDVIQLMDGPVESGEQRWWKVKAEKNNSEGWSMENQDWYSGLK